MLDEDSPQKGHVLTSAHTPSLSLAPAPAQQPKKKALEDSFENLLGNDSDSLEVVSSLEEKKPT